jgi:hypothetical protein
MSATVDRDASAHHVTGAAGTAGAGTSARDATAAHDGEHGGSVDRLKGLFVTDVYYRQKDVVVMVLIYYAIAGDTQHLKRRSLKFPVEVGPDPYESLANVSTHVWSPAAPHACASLFVLR